MSALDSKTVPDAARSEERGSVRPSLLRRFLPLVLIAAAAALFFATGLDEYVSLETLRRNHAALSAFVADHVLAAAALYFLVYAAATATSVPGGLALTITGGFLFGAVLGTVLTVAAATLGATIIFIVARSAFGDVLRRRAGGAVARMADGFREDAFNYLLVLRLVPLFPFFLVNLAPAFLGVRLRTYVLATLIGIVPGTFVYASVGAGLGSVFAQGGEISPSSVLTPQVATALVGLAVLSLIPVVYKRVKRRRSNTIP